MPVSIHSQSQNPDNTQDLRTQTTHLDAPHRLTSLDEEPALHNLRFESNKPNIRDVPISNPEVLSSVPPQMLPQHMGDHELS